MAEEPHRLPPVRVCPTDAIIGAATVIHNVMREAHRLLELYRDPRPTEAATVMKPVPPTPALGCPLALA